MNPSPQYLAALGGALPPVNDADVAALQGPLPGPTPPPPSYVAQAGQALGMGPAGPGAMPIMLGGQPLPSSAPPMPVAPPPTPPPTMAAPGLDGGMSKMPPPGPSASMAPSGPPMPPPDQPRFVQRGGTGGIIPAHEQEMRGPTLRNAQVARNAAFAGAADAVAEHAQHTASTEFAMALDQERKAGIREDAANYSAAERDAELAQRQADFDQSVKALSQTSVDPDRFWANKSTGSKLAAFVGMVMGGFLQGKHGGPNAQYDMVKDAMDRDIKAQEFSYNAARDTVNAKQTAFGLAMQKYNNVDAARAAARAASIDAIQAQVAQSAALWKGTDAANRATMLGAQLEEDKQNQIAQGIRFLPPSMAPRQFIDRRTGLVYSEAEMKQRQSTEEERDFKHGEKLVDIAGDIEKEHQKAGLKKGEEADKGAQHISQQLQTAGVPQARASAELALAALNKSPGGRLEAGARSALSLDASTPLLSNDANAREQAYQTFANQAMKAMMGNVTAGEEERARKMLGSAGDPESRRRAIQSTMDTLEAIEKNAKAGVPPEAQRKFDQQRQSAAGAPATVPKGGRSGW